MSNVYDALIKAARRTEAITPLSLSSQTTSRERKTMMLILGLLFVVIVSQLMGRALRNQIDERSAILTTNLSDAAAGYIASKDVLQLKTIVAKYARLSGVAYALIEDREGKVIAHSLAAFSPELLEAMAPDHGQVNRRELTLQGKTVYDTREPILDGQLGTAHIGIWAKTVDREINHAIFLFVWPVTLGLLGAAIIVIISARPLIGALLRLIELRLGSAQTPSTHLSE